MPVRLDTRDVITELREGEKFDVGEPQIYTAEKVYGHYLAKGPKGANFAA